MKKINYKEQIIIGEYRFERTHWLCMDYAGEWGHDSWSVEHNSDCFNFFGYPTANDIKKVFSKIGYKFPKDS